MNLPRALSLSRRESDKFNYERRVVAREFTQLQQKHDRGMCRFVHTEMCLSRGQGRWSSLAGLLFRPVGRPGQAFPPACLGGPKGLTSKPIVAVAVGDVDRHPLIKN
jgi:hypothetical protein